MRTLNPPRGDNRQRRHSMSTVTLARRMYGDGTSWTPSQIKGYLADTGIDVALHTVRLWVVPGMADEHRIKNRESYWRRRRGKTASVAPVLDRMLELRSAGLPFASIAKVIQLDLGVPLNSEQARYYVKTKREPSVPKRKAA
jgi:hypothetical protein